MSNEKLSIPEFEDTIEGILRSWNVPGAGIGVVKNGELVLARGFGVKEAGQTAPVDAETNFAIGSNTKAFTAACIGMLVEEGRLDWDDKVIRYLPDFALYDPWITREVTIRDLLSHRVGVCEAERFLYNNACSNAEVVRRWRYVQPAAPFRADFQYSNIGFMVAGEILRAITGNTWEEWVRDRIFLPLGMKRSTTNFEDAKALENIAMPHVNGCTGLLSIRARMADPVYPIPWYGFGSQAAGGITSNVLEMLSWLGMFLGNGTYQGKTILRPETVAMLTRPSNIIQNPARSMPSIAALEPDIQFWAYGLGWFVTDYKGRKFVFHGGQVQGMISLCGMMPQEELGFAILTNINLSVVQVILGLTICDAVLGGARRDWNTDYLGLVRMLRQGEEKDAQQLAASRKKAARPSLPLNAFTGRYSHDYFGEHTVSLEDAHLALSFSPRLSGDLEHWQDNEFLIHWRDDPFDGDFLTFSIGQDGQVDGFVMKQDGFFRKI